MPEILPSHVPSPRTALFWDGTAYRPGRIADDGTLQVRGEDQLHSFQDTLEVYVTGALTAADGYLESPAVPAGDLWVITNIILENATRNITSSRWCRVSGGVVYCFGCVTRAIPLAERTCWYGWEWAKPSDTIRGEFVGGQIGDVCHMWITGHRMSLEGGEGMYRYYVHLQDQKPQATHGGTFTLGAWRTRDITIELDDTGNVCAIAANQITLQPGTYRCLITCPAHAVSSHQARLRNITAGATLLFGTTDRTSLTTVVMTRSVITGRFTLAVASVLEIQHRCSFSQNFHGFGFAANFTTEVYTDAEFWSEFD